MTDACQCIYTVCTNEHLSFMTSGSAQGAALHSSVDAQHGLVGTAVTLGCSYTPPSASVENIDVWWKVSRNGVTETVFASQNDVVTKHTEGFTVNEDGLLKGDASLHLENTTIGHEGVYSCGVIIQPDQYDRTIHLKLSARPLVSLPELVTVMTGEERTLRCDITRFYPEQLKVTWRSEGGTESAQWDVCTGVPVPNSDGTFSVSSRITVKAEGLKSDATVYECRIEHRSFPELYRRNVTVRVQGPEQHYSTSALIAGTVISSVLFTVLAIGAAVVVYRRFHTGPPSVSDIIKPDIIYAKTPTKLSCTVRGVQPKHLKVQWYRMASCDGGTAGISESDSLIGMENLQELTQLQCEDSVHVSTVTLKLTVDDDNRGYRCVVHCGSTKITKDTTVRVKVLPDLLQISSQPQVPRLGQPLVLCCRIEKFYPADIRLEWHRQGTQLLPYATQFGPFSDQERLYSLWSKMELTVTNVDVGTVCTCRVYHTSFPAPFYKDVPYHISTEGRPPKVAFIKCDPPQPTLGTECTLNLCVKDFCPDPVTVTWYQDGERVSDGAFSSPASLNVNGLYSMWTFLKLTPSQQDLSSVFKCVVEHSALTEQEERQFTLAHTVEV
ncbi:hypothetical protein NFI96_019854 [Prochilodus magdalenae]|nr:hypothetical protein NFI96_019854 [Prochilodus magdalenae]